MSIDAALRSLAGSIPGDRGHPDGSALAEAAVPLAVRVIGLIRDEGPGSLAKLRDRLSGDETWALIVVLAALVPADVKPAQALEWADLPAREWSHATLSKELRRWQDGARDGIAVSAMIEDTHRRRAETRAETRRNPR